MRLSSGGWLRFCSISHRVAPGPIRLGRGVESVRSQDQRSTGASKSDPNPSRLNRAVGVRAETCRVLLRLHHDQVAACAGCRSSAHQQPSFRDGIFRNDIFSCRLHPVHLHSCFGLGFLALSATHGRDIDMSDVSRQGGIVCF